METFEADCDEDFNEYSDHEHSKDQDPSSSDIMVNTNLDQSNDNIDIPSDLTSDLTSDQSIHDIVSASDIDLNQNIHGNEIHSASEQICPNARVVVNKDMPLIRTRSGRNVRPCDILDL